MAWVISIVHHVTVLACVGSSLAMDLHLFGNLQDSLKSKVPENQAKPKPKTKPLYMRILDDFGRLFRT